ncbi:hypothetical protein ABQZ09_00205 [Xanthomonas sp. WHRI 6106]
MAEWAGLTQRQRGCAYVAPVSAHASQHAARVALTERHARVAKRQAMQRKHDGARYFLVHTACTHCVFGSEHACALFCHTRPLQRTMSSRTAHDETTYVGKDAFRLQAEAACALSSDAQ